MVFYIIIILSFVLIIVTHIMCPKGVIFSITQHLKYKRFMKRYGKINDNILSKIKTKGFKADKIFKVVDCFNVKTASGNRYQKIFIDSKNKRVCFIDYSEVKAHILDFSEIVGCEIYENSAVSGYTRKRKTVINNKCNDLQLIFKIDNPDCPQIKYNVVYEGCKLDKEGKSLKDIKDKLQEIKAFFDVINHQKTSKKKKFVYCRSCGAKNDAESLKCFSCGDKL